MLYLQCLASLTTPSIDSKPKKELPILYLQCLASLTTPSIDSKPKKELPMLYLQCLASLTTPSRDSKPKKELPMLYLQCLVSLTPPFQDMKYRQQTKERTSNVISLVFSFINSTISGYEVETANQRKNFQYYISSVQLH